MPAWVPFILLIIISVHSVISGIAIGVKPTIETTLSIFVAVISHKWVESFAVGVSLVRQKLHLKKFFILLLVYALAEPLGVGIGMIIVTFLKHGPLAYVEGCIGAFASGTFIYVATIDIMADEFARPLDKYWKVLSLFFGFGVMVAAMFVVPNAL